MARVKRMPLFRQPVQSYLGFTMFIRRRSYLESIDLLLVDVGEWAALVKYWDTKMNTLTRYDTSVVVKFHRVRWARLVILLQVICDGSWFTYIDYLFAQAVGQRRFPKLFQCLGARMLESFFLHQRQQRMTDGASKPIRDIPAQAKVIAESEQYDYLVSLISHARGITVSEVVQMPQVEGLFKGKFVAEKKESQ